jgi:hypothetical protein
MTIRTAFALFLCLPALAAVATAAPAQPDATCTTPDPSEGACRLANRGRTAAGRLIPTWRETATEDDRRRLREWRTAFVEALREARDSGHATEVAREGALLDPDAAIAGAALPPGAYRCRTVKLGSQGEEGLNFVAYPWFACRVAPGPDGLIHFTKLTGSQRPVGRLFAEHDRWSIFLGALQLGDEQRALRYGRDRERNLAGRIERIGERRWRIVFPYPHFESTLDVLELVPAS